MELGLSLQGTPGTLQYAGGPSEKLLSGGQWQCEPGFCSVVDSLSTVIVGQYAGGPSENLITGRQVVCEPGFCSAVVSLSAVRAEQCAGGPSEKLLTG